MLKWFRRKNDDKALAGMAEQELSTLRKLDVAQKAKEKFEELLSQRIERRFHAIPVEFERRQV